MNQSSLVKKLAHVMKQVQYIEKKGFNNFNKYKYATESDVQDKVRNVLADQNVIMMPDVIEHTTREHTNRKQQIEYIATVKVNFTFYDGDTGESISIHSSGEGQDAGDKAVYKAITGAQKYAIMKAFMIPTGDDPEGDNKTDESNNEQQSKSNPKEQQSQPKSNSITQEQVGLIKTKAMKYAEMRNGPANKVYEALSINEITNVSEEHAKKAIQILDRWIENAKGDANGNTKEKTASQTTQT